MTRKLQAALVFLLLLLAAQSMAYAATTQNTSQTGTTQTQSNEQAAGFDNPMAVYELRSEVVDLLSAGMQGFMLGAAIVVAQTLRRRAVPAQTIVLDL